MSNIDKHAKSVFRELIADARSRRLGKLIITADEMETILDDLDSVTRTLAVNHEAACSLVDEKDELVRKLETEQRISTTWRKTAESNREKLEAAEERYEDMLRQARSFREAHDSASEIIRQLERNKLVVKLPTTKLWAGKVACYEASEIIELLFSAGIRIQGED